MLPVGAVHTMGPTVVPDDVAPQSRLFRVCDHNQLLENDMPILTSRAQSIQIGNLGHQKAVMCHYSLLAPKLCGLHDQKSLNPRRVPNPS